MLFLENPVALKRWFALNVTQRFQENIGLTKCLDETFPFIKKAMDLVRVQEQFAAVARFGHFGFVGLGS